MVHRQVGAIFLVIGIVLLIPLYFGQTGTGTSSSGSTSSSTTATSATTSTVQTSATSTTTVSPPPPPTATSCPGTPCFLPNSFNGKIVNGGTGWSVYSCAGNNVYVPSIVFYQQDGTYGAVSLGPLACQQLYGLSLVSFYGVGSVNPIYLQWAGLGSFILAAFAFVLGARLEGEEGGGK